MVTKYKDYCRVPLCNSRHTHTTEAHHCRLCYMRHQGDHTCPDNVY